MKIKQGFIIRQLGEQFVVVATGQASLSFNGMIKLNSMGAFIWGLVEQELSVEEMIQAVLAKYEVSEEVAREDVVKFVKELEGVAISES